MWIEQEWEAQWNTICQVEMNEMRWDDKMSLSACLIRFKFSYGFLLIQFTCKTIINICPTHLPPISKSTIAVEYGRLSRVSKKNWMVSMQNLSRIVWNLVSFRGCIRIVWQEFYFYKIIAFLIWKNSSNVCSVYFIIDNTFPCHFYHR